MYSERLSSRLQAEIFSPKEWVPICLTRVLRKKADIYHVQFEYRGFGNFARSLFLLLCLTLLLRLRGIVVITLHGVIVPETVKETKFGWFAYLAFLTSVKLVAVFGASIVVHSVLMRRVLEETYEIMKTCVIPHGTDVQDFKSPRPLPVDHIVFLGFLRPSKGVENLIDAMTTILGVNPNVRLTVAGSLARREEAYYLEYLLEKVKRSNLTSSVEFVNVFLDPEQMSRLLQKASVVVLPYVDRFIEVSGVVHDVAGYGVPIVCSTTPRFSELTDGLDCLKVDPNPTELARAILRILSDPQLSLSISAKLRQKAASESWDVVAIKHLALYNRLAG